jgi:hypothetical protein
MAQFYHPVLKRMVDIAEPTSANSNATQALQMMNQSGDTESNEQMKWQQIYNMAEDLKTKNSIADSWEKRTGTKLFAVKEKSEAERAMDKKLKDVENNLTQLEDMYFASKDLSSGRLGGIGQKIMSMFGFNEPLKSYDSIISSMRPTLAKASGEVGNLTETEQKAAVAPLPNGLSTPEEAIAGFASIRRRFGLNQRDYSDMLDEDTKSVLTPEFYDNLNKRITAIEPMKRRGIQ